MQNLKEPANELILDASLPASVRFVLRNMTSLVRDKMHRAPGCAGFGWSVSGFLLRGMKRLHGIFFTCTI